MMTSVATKPICPSCLFSVTARVLYQSAHQRVPWTAQRFYRVQGRTTPARMLLSDDVARKPPRRDEHGRETSRPRRKAESPFGAMNRTVANIRERPPMREKPPKRERATGQKFAEFSSRDAPKKKSAPSDGRRVKAMKMQSSLTSISYGERTRAKADAMDLVSFDQFDLLPTLKSALKDDALRGLVDIKPTPIQRQAIPALLGMETGRRSRSRSRSDTPESGKQEFLLAAETGSGKTLAYLLPTVNAIKVAEAADPDIIAYREAFEKQTAAMREPDYKGPRTFEPHPTTARPRAIILVPTAELVEQVGAVTKSLSHLAKFKSIQLSANVSAKVIQASMYSPRGVDLIVATPHLLSSIAKSDPNILSQVTHLVIDEADSLFDRSFAPVTTDILDRALPSIKQLILCSATIPQRLDKYLGKEFPDMVRITTPNLHAIPRRVQLGVIDVSKDPFRNNKDLACADAIWAIGKEAARNEGPDGDLKRVMVFVNEREKTQEVAEYLKTKGIDAVALHRDTEEQRQSDMLSEFTSGKGDSDKEADPENTTTPQLSRKRLTNTKVIVATDLASRGIDTLAVRHVILYDVPHTTIDFIHRLGRAGRMGKRGRGIVLVGKGDRRDIVAEVRESMFMGQALI